MKSRINGTINISDQLRDVPATSYNALQHNLASIGQITSSGLNQVLFRKHDAIIIPAEGVIVDENLAIARAAKSSNNLYASTLPSSALFTYAHRINFSSHGELVNFYVKVFGSPTHLTLANAIRKKFFTLPGCSIETFEKNNHTSVSTLRGHMRGVSQHPFTKNLPPAEHIAAMRNFVTYNDKPVI